MAGGVSMIHIYMLADESVDEQERATETSDIRERDIVQNSCRKPSGSANFLSSHFSSRSDWRRSPRTRRMAPPPPKRRWSKKKRHWNRLSFCQKLARTLENNDRNHTETSAARKQERTRHNNARSPLTSLPAELRQEILYFAIEDEDLLHKTKMKRRARALARVCKTLRDDMHLVQKRWKTRHDQLLRDRDVQRGHFNSYIEDLMAPIQTHARCMRTWSGVRQPTGALTSRLFGRYAWPRRAKRLAP